MDNTYTKIEAPSPSEIKAIRKSLGLSQTAFADQMGVTFSTVNRWENGHRKPTRLAIFRLAKLKQATSASVHVSASPLESLRPSSCQRAAIVLRGRVVLFDPAEPEKLLDSRNQYPLPKELGPPRSISFDMLYGKPVLLIGTRCGVVLHHPDGGEPDIRFTLGGASTRGLGVNSAVINHGCLYATHSEQGLWRWKISNPTGGEPLFTDLLKGKQTVRSLAALDHNRAMFIADKELYAFTADSTVPDLIYQAPQGGRLTSANLFEHTVFLASSDGRISHFDLVFRRQQSLLSYEQSRLYSARIARCMNAPFLVLGMRKAHVLLIGIGENHERIAYRSGSRNMRFATATNTHVLGVDHDQNELFIWNADEPETPAARIPVGQSLKHHIQDICVFEDTQEETV